MTKRSWSLLLLLFFIITGVSTVTWAEGAQKKSEPSQGPEKVERDMEEHQYKDPIKLKKASAFCIDCHQDESPVIFKEWVKSPHARAGVGCADCHEMAKGDPTAFSHKEKYYISTVVTPFICAKCHEGEMRDYFTSGHAKALELLKEMKEDDLRYPVVAQYKEDNFIQCGGCHGVEVKVNEEHRPDPATWPNSGAGRINPNKSHGSCASCHMGHGFSVAAARQPETCLRCHDGRNYPEGEIYRNSAHGVIFEKEADKGVLNRPGYFLRGEDIISPTCAFCHFNGSGHGLLTRHNAAWRLPRDLTYPEAPVAPRAENLRNNMKSVCKQCHTSRVIDSFFEAADAKLLQYQKNVVEPKLTAYKQKLSSIEGEPREKLLKEYSGFLAESKRYRMNLYMGRHGRVQR